MEGLEQGSVTAALVGLVLVLSKVIQSLSPGGKSRPPAQSHEREIAVIKQKIECLQECADETKDATEVLCRQFVEFRQEVMLQFEREKVREETLREVRNEQSAG